MNEKINVKYLQIYAARNVRTILLKAVNKRLWLEPCYTRALKPTIGTHGTTVCHEKPLSLLAIECPQLKQ